MVKTISVIVPIYNVEPYLSQCIESILAQSYTDYEIILVDDGSVDNSGSISDFYAKKDNRIKVIHKENGGLVSARKVGFEASCGKYIANIDSDDWIEPNHLEVLYNAISQNNADIVQSNFYKNSVNSQLSWDNKPDSEDALTVIQNCLQGKIHAGLWTKLIKRDLYENKDFHFPLFSHYEDMHTSISLLLKTKKFVHVPFFTYHYRYNPESLTHKKDIQYRLKMSEEFIRNMNDLYFYYQLHKYTNIDKAFKQCVNINKRFLIKNYFNQGKHLSKIINLCKYTFNWKDIHSIGDFFFFMASQWNIFYPYYLKNRFHLGHE